MSTKVLFSFYLALVIASMVASAMPDIASTSIHDLKFTGLYWDSLIQGKSAELSQAIENDVLSQVRRSAVVNTTAFVLDLSGDSLKARVAVQQRMEQNTQNQFTHIWKADEVNALLSQGTYTETLALYQGPGEATFAYAMMPSRGLAVDAVCNNVCKGMIIMASIIGFLMIATFFAVVCFRCCRRARKTTTRDKEETEPINSISTPN